MNMIYDPNATSGTMLTALHDQLITVKGKLVYDPRRPGFKKTHKMRTLIIELPKDNLSEYYRWFLERSHGQWLQLQPPMYGLHITVVGGNEHVPNLAAWEKHKGRVVEVKYAPIPRQHWQFWSLPLYGVDELQEMRKELGMSPEKDFHITIGRQYDWQPIPRRSRRQAWEIRQEMERDLLTNDLREL